LPKLIRHDDGNEWKGVFKQFLADKNVEDVAVNSRNHHTLGVIDRFARTLKENIEKSMTGYNTVNWINKLQELVNLYNNTPHRGIDEIKPNQATTPKNQEIISEINHQKAIKNAEINKGTVQFKVGDLVRVKSKKTQFSKGYSATFSKKIYKIINVYIDKKVMLDDKKIVEFQDLQKIPDNSSSINGDIQATANKTSTVNRKLKLAGVL
jgi:hypothetical protein